MIVLAFIMILDVPRKQKYVDLLQFIPTDTGMVIIITGIVLAHRK
jgi:hypothetical protein